jgi:hypothetical protein
MEQWQPSETAGYDAAADVLHVLSALCSAQAWRDRGEARTTVDWLEVRDARTREWRKLDPTDQAQVARFVDECRGLIARLQQEAP